MPLTVEKRNHEQRHKDSFDGDLKTYKPRGFVSDKSNAVWGMQFFWPIKADYRIIYLNEDYSITVIGRNKRDYVWIMARNPSISEPEYTEITQWLGSYPNFIALLEELDVGWQET